MSGDGLSSDFRNAISPNSLGDFLVRRAAESGQLGLNGAQIIEWSLAYFAEKPPYGENKESLTELETTLR